MKIKEGNAVDGLLNGEVDILLHVVNNQSVMGSGIALEIKNRIPSAYEEYLKTPMILGEVGICEDGVYNLHAQDNYGRGKRQLNYGAFSDCINTVAQVMFQFSDSNGRQPVIGIPYRIGSDRAGADWAIIKEMIEYYLEGYEIICYKLGG